MYEFSGKCHDLDSSGSHGLSLLPSLTAIFKTNMGAGQTSSAIFDIFVPLCNTELNAGSLSCCNPFQRHGSEAQRWPLVSEPAAASWTEINFGVGQHPHEQTVEYPRSADWPITPISNCNQVFWYHPRSCFYSCCYLMLCNRVTVRPNYTLFTFNQFLYKEQHNHFYFSICCPLFVKENETTLKDLNRNITFNLNTTLNKGLLI